MTRCDWALLCDYAFFDEARKPCLVGVFHSIVTRKLPANHHRCALVFRVTGEAGEKTRMLLSLTQSDSSGEPLLQFENPHLDLGPAGEHVGIVNVANLPLPSEGSYKFQIALDGCMAKEVSFDVVRERE